jgi:putative transposase
MNGLPDLRSLPDAPVPDGRTVLPNRDARGAEAVMGHGRHLRRFILDTNLLERTFVEVRRRTKVIGRFPGENSALSLTWAVLELSSRGWRGVVMTPRSVAEIQRLRRRQVPTRTKEVAAAKHPPRAELRPALSPGRRDATARIAR